MFVNLDRIKQHLNIDPDFTGDDEYLIYLEEVAELVIQEHIDNNLSELCDVDGAELPAPLQHAILLFIGNMYNSRESVSFASAMELPFSYDYLLSLYKNYSNSRLTL